MSERSDQAIDAPLSDLAAASFEQMLAQWPNAPESARAQLRRALLGSEFLAREISFNLDAFAAAWRAGSLTAGLNLRPLLRELRDLANHADEATAMRELRRIRRRELAGIIYRDLCEPERLPTTLTELSRLADALMRAALSVAERLHAERFGVLRDAEGEEIRLVVLALGKLGGGELNLSSDIDLIFAFRAHGEADGRKQLAASDYMTRLVRRLVKLLDEVSGDGFVYRTDTRLRPHGGAGQLALSFDAMLAYYQREGRDWERYALIKARPVAGQRQDGRRLLRELRPFVYRRYIDFGVFEAIRRMKRDIERELGDARLATDIKKGRGGIREIEFVVQTLQLLRGGREPRLQGPSLYRVLEQLRAQRLIEEDDYQVLNDSYCLLRQVENRLQAWRDEQTHELPPDDEPAWERLAATMDCEANALQQSLRAARARVHEQFTALLAPEQASAEHDQEERWLDAWREDHDADWLGEYWPGVSSEQSDLVTEMLNGLKASRAYRLAGRVDRQRTDAFMARLLACLAEREQRVLLLERMLRLVHVVIRRSAYLALLLENRDALQRLLQVFTLSERIAEWIIEAPVLLDELLDDRLLSGEVSRARRPELEHIDLEQALIRLVEWRQASQFRLAVQVHLGKLAPEQVAHELSLLAEHALIGVYRLSLQAMRERYGSVPGEVGIIAYGKLGSKELGFDSDLDIVAVHPDASERGDGRIEPAVFYRRHVQRLHNGLSGQGPAGRLYEVDMRLRPNGESGLLVSSMEAFEKYQNERAWVWELQALVRARWVIGPPELAARFEQLRKAVLAQERDPERLREEVAVMRDRLLAEFGQREGARAAIKFRPGGLLDVEFIAQYLVLRYAAETEVMLTVRRADQIIATAAEHELLEAESARTLSAAWQAYTRATQWLDLGGELAELDLEAHFQAVAANWQRLLQ